VNIHTVSSSQPITFRSSTVYLGVYEIEGELQISTLIIVKSGRICKCMKAVTSHMQRRKAKSINGKVRQRKFVPVSWKHTGEWRYSSTFLYLGTRWRWGLNLTPLPFYLWGKSPGTHCIGGWVGPRSGLNAVEKRRILYCRESNSSCPASSPSLYRLSYPDS
jgi:hypothetical protein